MQIITSKENQLVKHICKLKEKKYRTQYNEFIVEGVKLVKEAIKENAKIKNIVINKTGKESKLIEKYLGNELEKINYVQVEDNIFKLISEVENPQGILAVVQKKFEKNEIKNEEMIVALDGLQDPGNLGTLLRSAVAFGFDGVILGDGCVDVYNEKVIRSTQGAIFKIPIEFHSLKEYVPMLQANGVKVYGTSLENGQPLGEIEEDSQMAFILGNEGQGVNPELLSTTNRNIFIEMTQNIESLNVSIAGSIIMYRFRL